MNTSLRWRARRLALAGALLWLTGCGAAGPSSADMLERIGPAAFMVRAAHRGAVALSVPPAGGAPELLPAEPGSSPLGRGTGVLLDDGYLVTEAQVVEGASTRAVTVHRAGGVSLPARVVGVSVCDNLALLRVAPDDALRPARLGASDRLRVGQDVIAVGYGVAAEPGEPPRAVQAVVARPIGGEAGQVYEIDAAVAPGDAGGPILSRSGSVVGMVVAHPLAAGAPAAQAISASHVRAVVERLKQGDGDTRLGMQLGEIPSQPAPNEEALAGAYFGPATAEGGLLVQAVSSDGAAIMGVRPGDLIVRLDGRPVTTIAGLCGVLAEAGGSARLPVEVLRRAGGEVQLLHGTLHAPVPADMPIPLDVSPALDGAAAPAPAAEVGVPGAAPAPAAGPVTPLPKLDPAGLEAARQAHLALRAPFREVVFDTFDNEGTKARWSPVDDVAFARQLVHSYYQLTLKRPNLTTADIWRERALGASYIVELAVALMPPAAGRTAAGIIYDAQGDGGSFSAFLIGSDGTWETVTYQGQAVIPERFARAATDAIVPGQGTNVLRVVRRAGETQLWINDTPVAALAAGPFGGGAVGVIVTADAAAGAPAGAVVDNLRVLEGAP